MERVKICKYLGKREKTQQQDWVSSQYFEMYIISEEEVGGNE